MPSSQIFIEILTNSTLNLPPRLRCDLTPPSFLAQFGHPTSNFAAKMRQAVDSQFTVYSHNFSTVRLFQGPSLGNGRRVLLQRTSGRREGQTERAEARGRPCHGGGVAGQAPVWVQNDLTCTYGEHSRYHNIRPVYIKVGPGESKIQISLKILWFII